jgi:ABC-type transporter Mla maintaining outer membrane lipid asymmetry permease subunit MlaE
MKLIKKATEILFILSLTVGIMLAFLGYLSFNYKKSEKGIRECVEIFLGKQV